jgi:hypothetical protein
VPRRLVSLALLVLVLAWRYGGMASTALLVFGLGLAWSIGIVSFDRPLA